jgi:hypothetical protein
MPIRTPRFLKLKTSMCLGSDPSAGVKVISNFPGRSTTKSVALYYKITAVRYRFWPGGFRMHSETYLISEGVSADDNRASPALKYYLEFFPLKELPRVQLRRTRNQSGDVLADNGFSEDSTTQNITDSTVRAQPHLLQAEFYEGKQISKVH